MTDITLTRTEETTAVAGERSSGVYRGRAVLHEPGIYLDLPMRDYINDPALSGSGIKKLLTSPADWRYEQADNDLFEAPESDARQLGTLVHCAVLEGFDAFAERYAVQPDPDALPNVMKTSDDMKAWLKDHDLPVSGTKAVQAERIKGHWQVLSIGGAPNEDEPIFWDDVIEQLTAGGRELIKPKADRYVRQVAQMVGAWSEAQDLLSDGMPEVSVFWEDSGVRYKSRFDWISGAGRIRRMRYEGPIILDAKKFGQAPPRGKALWQYLQREIHKYDYDLQAVHNRRAALMMPLLIDQNAVLSASGANASARLEKVQAIAEAFREQAPLFTWLFLRTPGPPQGFIMPFGDDTKRWEYAESDIDIAVENYRRYREQCGDGLWIEVGIAPWDDEDMPEYTWDIARV